MGILVGSLCSGIYGERVKKSLHIGRLICGFFEKNRNLDDNVDVQEACLWQFVGTGIHNMFPLIFPQISAFLTR